MVSGLILPSMIIFTSSWWEGHKGKFVATSTNNLAKILHRQKGM